MAHAHPLARGRPGLALAACSALHTVNDALFAVVYPLLPLIAEDLQLGYAEVGLVKTAFSAASSLLQVPVALLAERWGEYALLVGGHAWVSAGLIGMGFTTSYLPLLALAILAGLGGNTQHPLAASLVSRSAAPSRRATAVGTLNFAGDLGKMAGPPVVALVAVPLGWRAALIGLGLFSLVFSLVVWRLPVQPEAKAPPVPDRPSGTPDDGEQPALGATGWGIEQPRQYGLLSALGMIDSATRGAALAFLPFLLASRGLDAAQVSLLFTLVFLGGALGKFGCGGLADRVGPTALILGTELVTVGLLVSLPMAPLELIPLVALAFGFVLNGTSSVLYARVADLVSETRRSRGYGLYYTLVNSSSALAPVAFGLVGDRAGLLAIFGALAAVHSLTIPLGLAIKPR